jgi:hypothetical protein
MKHYSTFARAAVVVASLLALITAPSARAQSAPSTPPQVMAPNTPAGHVLGAWLDAFDSGDSARIAAFYRSHDPDRSAPGDMSFRDETGGFDLVSVLKSEPQVTVFLLKERKSETRARGRLVIGSGPAGSVTAFTLSAIPKGATVASFTIDGATRQRVVDSIIGELNAHYVSPDVAKQMGDAVRAQEQRGAYASVTDGYDFADTLTADLRAVSHDRHLRVNFNPSVIPLQTATPSPEAQAENRKQLQSLNCGFDRVERLPNNVGYLKFDFFAPPDACAPTVVAAMNFLGHVDALIIDTRENHGGSPSMVSFILSYLFAEPTHVNDMYERDSNRVQQYWTSPYVPGPRLDKVPVFLLTSKATFSGGEEFAYDLKNLKRATIIGETTGGGAHPVSGHRIDDHFAIGVPFGHPINPVSKTDWEGVGVEPDVKVPAAEALTRAEKLAADTLAAVKRVAANTGTPK